MSVTPDGVRKLAKAGHKITVQDGAGLASGFTDTDYAQAGAKIRNSVGEVLDAAETIIGINAVRRNVADHHTIVGLLDPLWDPIATAALASSEATLLSLELIPRITRAQSMDVLSSMATVAGYEAVLLGATKVPKLFPLLMTAAGTVPAARILVLGAGVAGLQAIATAKRLGGVVHAYDVRPAAAEQIESVGGKSIQMDTAAAAIEDDGGYAQKQAEETNRDQREWLTPFVAEADLVITTAAIPGAKSPVLITETMVQGMSAGSVVVDLAAQRGGNCSLTVADEEVSAHDVLVLGPTDLESRSPQTASEMFSNNVCSLLAHLTGESGELVLDLADEITQGTLVATGGEITNPRVFDALQEAIGAAETESDS